ncbi:MAG: CPBP family intramembrane metalloprotease [Bacteroidales bacterium]|nr:CPBP family intramembrane metalloprotease [Bacteroidales bacterium]
MIKGALANLTPFTKLLLIFLMIMGSSIFVTMLFMFAAIPFTGIEEFKALITGAIPISYLKYLQVVQAFSVFIFPSLILAWLLSERPWIWLGFTKIKWILVLTSVTLFIVCQPLVTFLANINSHLLLPEFLKPVEDWMRSSEDSASELVYQFLDTRNPFAILLNLIMIVLLPAIGEEMLFRGTIQPVIGQWTKSIHWAVWITAFLFSAMHMQFFTFLPRFLLGVLLGYLLVYGKSIWYPIAGHFMNNFLSLIIFYYLKATKPDVNPMDSDTNNYNIWMVMLSFVLVTALVVFIRKKTKSHSQKKLFDNYDV